MRRSTAITGVMEGLSSRHCTLYIQNCNGNTWGEVPLGSLHVVGRITLKGATSDTGQGPKIGSCEYGNEHWSSTEGWEFLG
jgi:hypothetical protein